jgi:spore maturation protein CgeB
MLKTIIVLTFLSGLMLTMASAKPEYAKKEGKPCTFCHVKMGSKELNDAGKYYQAHDHSLKGYKAPAKGA